MPTRMHVRILCVSSTSSSALRFDVSISKKKQPTVRLKGQSEAVYKDVNDVDTSPHIVAHETNSRGSSSPCLQQRQHFLSKQVIVARIDELFCFLKQIASKQAFTRSPMRMAPKMPRAQAANREMKATSRSVARAAASKE